MDARPLVLYTYMQPGSPFTNKSPCVYKPGRHGWLKALQIRELYRLTAASFPLAKVHAFPYLSAYDWVSFGVTPDIHASPPDYVSSSFALRCREPRIAQGKCHFLSAGTV